MPGSRLREFNKLKKSGQKSHSAVPGLGLMLNRTMLYRQSQLRWCGTGVCSCPRKLETAGRSGALLHKLIYDSTPAAGPVSSESTLRCNDAAVVAVPPHACSECACLYVVPDKPRLCTPLWAFYHRRRYSTVTRTW